MRRPALAALLLSLTACLDSLFETLPDVSPFPTGAAFAYTSTGFTNDTLLVGTITLAATGPGDSLTGTWEAHWPPGADSTSRAGLTSGNGTLRGSVWRNEAILVLDASDTTYQFVLQAVADPAGWSGRWNYRRGEARYRGGSFTASLVP